MNLVQPSQFTIESLEIESFRAYNNKHTFTFKEPLTVLHGKNGNGKSSTLYAIEWCLFGHIEFLRFLDGKANDEVINQFNPSSITRVKMSLSNGTEKVVLERTKKTGKAKTQFNLQVGGEEFEDSEAEEKLFLLSGMTLDDFIRSVYLHQEAIRALLTDDPAKRDDALDRLFGLERLRNIAKGIPVKDVREKIEKLNQKKEKMSEKIRGGITVYQDQLSRLEEKASEEGVKKDEINLDGAVRGARQIINEISSLCEDYSIEKPELVGPAALSDFPSFQSKLKKELKRLEKEGVDDEKIAALGSKKRKVEELMAAVVKQDGPIKEIEGQISEMVSNDGDEGKISEKVASIEKDVASENRKRDVLDTNAKLIGDAIASLKVLTEPVCPVCRQDIDIPKTLHELEGRSDKMISEQIRQISSRISELMEEKSRLEETAGKIGRLRQQLQEEKKTQDVAIAELAAELEVALERDALLTASAKKAEEYKEEISRLEKSAENKTSRFQEIRESSDRVGLIVDILNKKMEIGQLKKVFKDDSSQIEEIGKAITDLESFEDRLQKIVKAAGRVQTNLASDMISASEKDIEKFYSKLCMHKNYDRMKIEVKPKENRTGLVKNSYAIKAFSARGKQETHVASRFSTGQMNCVALSIFFALTKALPLKLGFVMLDDPSQNLDHDHKAVLAEIVTALAPERQIFIATQDKEFKDMLLQKSKGGKFYEFTGIDTSGPKFN